MRVDLLVEGPLDEVVARRLLSFTNHEVGSVYGKRGCSYILDKIHGFNDAIVTTPLFVMLDLMDTKHDCAAVAARVIMSSPNPLLKFRLVVREAESWLLADRKGLSEFLGVSFTKLPLNPETLSDPKRTLIDLARKSRFAKRKAALVPDQGLSSPTGKLYVSEMSRFVREEWLPENARCYSESLDSCIHRLETM
jgi:hypothetical protein